MCEYRCHLKKKTDCLFLEFKFSLKHWKIKKKKSWSEVRSRGPRASQVTHVKNLPTNVGEAGDTDWIALRRSTGERNGNPLQYSCLENPITEESSSLQSMG